MRCDECREKLRAFLDGEIDDRTRTDVGRHLAECPDCLAQCEDARFWEDAVRAHLDHELPADLKARVLGDLTDAGAAAAAAADGAHDRIEASDRSTGAGAADQAAPRRAGPPASLVRIAWWAIRRDLARPRGMLQAAAVAVIVIVAVNTLPIFRSGPDDRAAFTEPGPIVHVGPDGTIAADRTDRTGRTGPIDTTEQTDPGRRTGQTGPAVGTARLTLSGRLI